MPASICAGFSHALLLVSPEMMECQCQPGAVLKGRDDDWSDENDSDEEVDRFIGQMGLIVSDGDGNEVKLSKYLKMSEDREKASKLDHGNRELKKLEWDMKDVLACEGGDKFKRSR